MTQVKEMTNEHLNIALSKLMGRTEATAVMVNYGLITKYCEDPAASLEVQVAACKVDPLKYIMNLQNTLFRCSVRHISRVEAARLANASPRERAEAAYLTLKGGEQ